MTSGAHPTPRPARSGRRRWLRALASAALLAGVVTWMDPAVVWARLAGLEPAWVAAALGVTVLQVLASAWRWRFTLGRMGIDLPFGAAVVEYWVATFLNQVLPGGVVGDVSRAWRHARRDPGLHLRAAHGVLLERASGQAVMIAVAAASGAVLAVRGGAPGIWVAATGVALAAVALTLGTAATRRLARLSRAGPLRGDARAAFVEGGALPVQAGTSLVVVGTYLAVYVASARAVGVDTPAPVLLPLVAPVLLTMLLPVTVAGWGLREGAAAALWGSVGLGAADGVAISVAYGLLVLVSSLPGALALALTGLGRRARAGPDRTARPAPAGSDAPAAGWRPPGSPPAEG